jgi:acetylornithine/succinyldiaminopimelate/putrescine aminotransferase
VPAGAAEAPGAFGECAKHEIVALRGAFHGRTMGVLAATDRAAYRAPFQPLAAASPSRSATSRSWTRR